MPPKPKPKKTQPRRLTDFYPVTDSQDGAAGEEGAAAAEIQGDVTSDEETTTHDPVSKSLPDMYPEPSLQHTDEQSSEPITDTETLSKESPSAGPDTLEKQPSSEAPASENYIKHMLLTFKKDLSRELSGNIDNIQQQIEGLGTRTDHVENKMGAFAKAHNELVDAYNEQAAEIRVLRNALSAVQDQMRQPNIKIRNIPESVNIRQLRPYVMQLLEELLPLNKPSEFIMDSAYRINKPKHLPESLPRDVIVALHYSHIKEDLMSAMRKRKSLPEPFEDLQIYNDISSETSRQRKEFLPITKVLREENIQYRWGRPAKLHLQRDNIPITIYNLEDGLMKLHKWGLIATPVKNTKKKHYPRKMSQEWENSSKKKKRNNSNNSDSA